MKPHQLSRDLPVAVALLLSLGLVLSPFGRGLDRWGLTLLQSWSPPWVMWAFSGVTLAGNGYVTSLAVLLLARSRPRDQALWLIAVFVGMAAVEWLGKWFVHHPGPAALGLRPAGYDWFPLATPLALGNGFPSGHAARSLFVALALRGLRTAVRLILLLVVGTVGLGLVALGDHWPSEVLAGWGLAGLAWSLFEIRAKTSSLTGR